MELSLKITLTVPLKVKETSIPGVVGEVQRGQADLTFDLSITYQRLGKTRK